MNVRRTFIAALLTLVSLTLSGRVVAQAGWAVEKKFQIGGDGGWDYVTLDAKNHRLYIPRSTITEWLWSQRWGADSSAMAAAQS